MVHDRDFNIHSALHGYVTLNTSEKHVQNGHVLQIMVL